MTNQLHDLTAIELREQMLAGEVTAREVSEHFLSRAEALNGELRAFTHLSPECARARVGELEREEGLKHTLPLWGIPIGDKDLDHRAGMPTSWGSRLGSPEPQPESGRLARDLDASGTVSIGKTNCPEFGFPAYTENLIGEPARNPWDTTRTPGGSSGGAAVAVAARMLPCAPGSDGGGSIRIPAAACGLVGLKPSRGRVPGGTGIDQLAGLPVSGPLARTVEDAALLLDGMIGPRHGDGRAHDPFALDAPHPERSYLAALRASETPRNLRVGVSTWTPWTERMEISWSDGVQDVLDRTVSRLAALGHDVLPAPTPERWQGYADAFRTVWQAGGAALPVTDEALEHVEPLTRWLVGVGRQRTAAELAHALKWLTEFEARVIAAYEAFDVILTPILNDVAPALGSFDPEDGERNFEQQCQFTPFTSYVNVAGLPAIALPIAADPLPIGVQLIGRAGDELTLLRLGQQLEREFAWRKRACPLETVR